MRDISKVVSDIMALVPDGDIKNELERLQQDIKYSAPEMVGERWYQFETIMNLMPYPPKEEWQRKAANIFINEEKF